METKGKGDRGRREKKKKKLTKEEREDKKDKKKKKSRNNFAKDYSVRIFGLNQVSQFIVSGNGWTNIIQNTETLEFVTYYHIMCLYNVAYIKHLDIVFPECIIPVV